tara:strand:+ start:601 stop:987 length:387 start_codon:yes stop_codon:yes gene_type:complete
MATLTGKAINNTYKDILTVNSGTDNQGVEATLKKIMDGDGVETPLSLSTTTIGIGSPMLTSGITEFVMRTTSGATGDVFSVEVGENAPVFDITHQGVVKFKQNSSAPTAVAGGMYCDNNENFYIGVDS